MSVDQTGSNLPQVRSGPIITGAALVAAGGLIALAGLVIGGAHLFQATRRWIQEMETPPSELARQNWARAKAAALAGSSAWQDGTQVRESAE